MQTLQDMLTVEDFDVSDAFQHSRSTESVKSAASETYMSKINIAKRRANQQETETFYFTVSGTLVPESSSCLLTTWLWLQGAAWVRLWGPEVVRSKYFATCFHINLPGVVFWNTGHDLPMGCTGIEFVWWLLKISCSRKKVREKNLLFIWVRGTG